MNQPFDTVSLVVTEEVQDLRRAVTKPQINKRKQELHALELCAMYKRGIARAVSP